MNTSNVDTQLQPWWFKNKHQAMVQTSRSLAKSHMAIGFIAHVDAKKAMKNIMLGSGMIGGIYATFTGLADASSDPELLEESADIELEIRTKFNQLVVTILTHTANKPRR